MNDKILGSDKYGRAICQGDVCVVVGNGYPRHHGKMFGIFEAIRITAEGNISGEVSANKRFFGGTLPQCVNPKYLVKIGTL